MRMSKLLQKTLIGAVILFGIIAISTSVYSAWNLNKNLLAEYKSKGVAITQTIAQSSAQLLFGSPYETIQSLIDTFLDIRGVSYVFVYNDQSQIVAHTFAPTIPEVFSNLPKQSSSIVLNSLKEDVKIQELKIPNLGKVVDLELPILGGFGGAVHLGLDYGLIDNQIWSATTNQLGIIALLFCLSTLTAYVLVGRLSRDMNKLIRGVQQVEVGHYDSMTQVNGSAAKSRGLTDVAKRDDELGRLARVFQQMAQTVKTREQELAEAKEQLEAVLNAVPGSISWIDSGGVFIGVNRHLAENWNLSQDAFIGKDVGFLQGNTQLAHSMREFLASSHESASQIIEVNIDDDAKYYLVAMQKYQQGNATVSVGIDITERKKAEDALRQSEATNCALVNAIPDLLLRVSRDGTYLNDAVGADRLKLFSGGTTSLAQTTVQDSLPPEQAQQRMDAIEQALKTGALQVYEQRLVINGKPIDEEVRVVVTGEDEALVIVRDVSDRKQAEESLRIAEENYRSIFENALEGIFQSSPEGRFVNVNPALAKIYGYDSPTEMIKSITNIGEQLYVDPGKRDEFSALLEAQSSAKDFEYQSYCKDRSIIWTQIDARAVKDSHGRVLYYEGMVQDVTDRKRREDELRRQLKELKIEIDQKKREKAVALLTESSYFQEVQQEMAEVNLDEFWS